MIAKPFASDINEADLQKVIFQALQMLGELRFSPTLRESLGFPPLFQLDVFVHIPVPLLHSPAESVLSNVVAEIFMLLNIINTNIED